MKKRIINKMKDDKDNTDDDLIDILNNIYNSIYKHDIDKIINSINNLIKQKKIKNNYLNSLLNPDIYKYSKIPSLIPVPTCSFHIHNYVDIDTTSGKIAIIFNPFFLYRNDFTIDTTISEEEINNLVFYDNGKSETWGTMYDNNDPTTKIYEGYYRPFFLSTLLVSTGSGLNDDPTSCYWTPYNIGQDIPDMYSRYRLVSCCVTLRYMGPKETASGVIGGSIINLNNNRVNGDIGVAKYYITTTSSQFVFFQQTNITNDDYLINYGNFRYAMNSYYHKENNVNDGIKLIYYPIDNSYEEFIQPLGPDDIYNYSKKSNVTDISLEAKSNYKNGFNFFLYTLDGNDEYSYRFDIYCNFEGIPSQKYLDYLPISADIDDISKKEKKDLINLIRTNSIRKIDENVVINENSDWKGKLRKIKEEKLNNIKNIYTEEKNNNK